MLGAVAISPLVNYGGHDACWKQSLDRLYLITWPRYMLETVARSPLISHDVQDAW